MGKKGRKSSSSPSPSSITKSNQKSGIGSRRFDSSPKYPTVQKSPESKDGLTPSEMKMAEASKVSRLNAIANKEAINNAVGVLEKSKAISSNPTPAEQVINALATEDTINAQAHTNEAVIHERPKVGALANDVEEVKLPENWEDIPMIQAVEDGSPINSSLLQSNPDSINLHKRKLGTGVGHSHSDGTPFNGSMNQGAPNESHSMGYNLEGANTEFCTAFDLSSKQIPHTQMFEGNTVHNQSSEHLNGQEHLLPPNRVGVSQARVDMRSYFLRLEGHVAALLGDNQKSVHLMQRQPAEHGTRSTYDVEPLANDIKLGSASLLGPLSNPVVSATLPAAQVYIKNHFYTYSRCFA